MATYQSVHEATQVFELPAGEAVQQGDLLFFDSGNSDYRLADADAAAVSDVMRFAQFIALSDTILSGDGGVVLACKEAVLYDPDNNSFGSTVDAPLYLSTTAGGITSTRPTGANDIKQRVGTTINRDGDTGGTYAHVRLSVSEITINLMLPYAVSAAPVDRDNDFVGIGLDDTSAEVGGSFMVPENATGRGPVIAYLWWCGTGTVLDSSDTYTFDVSAGIDDETTSATTDGITAASLAVAANDLNRATVTTGFDASGVIQPGNIVGVVVKKAAEGTTGDDPIVLSCQIVLEVAG